MEQDHPYDAEQKLREERAYELAEYMRRHPAKHTSLPLRVAHLTGLSASNPELDRLLPEVEYWLELFDWQKESNS